MERLRKILEKINTNNMLDVRCNEPMALHTTFRIGGPADFWIAPKNANTFCDLVRILKEMQMQFIVLGGCSNILVGDLGIRGIVISTDHLSSITVNGTGLTAEAGAKSNSVCHVAHSAGLSGMEFLSALPGSIGGAIYMNARCYDTEISDILEEITWINQDNSICSMKPEKENGDWSYKCTPFMKTGSAENGIILNARFNLISGIQKEIAEKMEKIRQDRIKKGHFDWPSAGSMFKNNHKFGRPTGQILDELGFKGRQVGGAMVCPNHANIFVNHSNAKATDVLKLIEEAQKTAFSIYGHELETEVILVGEF